MKLVGIFKKIIPYLIISVLLITAGSYIYGKSQQYNRISHSTYSVSEKGCKALFLLTAEMGYHTLRHEKSAAFFPQNTTMVILDPDSRYLNKLELKLIKDWLAEGNTMILAGQEGLMRSYFNDLMQNPTYPHKDKISVRQYKPNKGNVIFIDNYNQFTNVQLKDYRAAVNFIELLESAGNKNVSFNEYYHGIGKGKTGGFDIMSLAMQLALLQLIIAVVLLLLSLSKRFGVPVTVNEIVKRQENEKVFALSNIFIKARANSVALEIYRDKFYRELKKYLGLPHDVENAELIRFADKDAILNKADAADAMQHCEDYINKKGKSNKELAVIIRSLDEIRKVMRQ